jgi:hypothetical protein
MAVTITGEHLRKASQVLFGGTPAASFTVVNEKTLVAISPPRAPYITPYGQATFESVDVTVVSGDNPSPSVAADRFHVHGAARDHGRQSRIGAARDADHDRRLQLHRGHAGAVRKPAWRSCG